MLTFSYQLRPGVELAVELRVTLRRNLDNPTQEMLENLTSDSKSALYTQEYLQVHVEKAFQSFAPTPGEVAEQVFKKAC